VGSTIESPKSRISLRQHQNAPFSFIALTLLSHCTRKRRCFHVFIFFWSSKSFQIPSQCML